MSSAASFPPTEALDHTRTAPQQRRVPWGAVITFTLIACALGWLVALPLWLNGGLANPLWPVVAGVIMFMPGVAALLVIRWVTPQGTRSSYLGLTPVRPWRRLATWSAIGLGAPLVLGAGALLLAAGLGLAEVQVSGSGMVLVASAVPLALALAVLTFGEELGWRGFLLHALEPLGKARAITLTGVIWGLWHAPLVLLGYNYQTTSAISLLWMSITGVLIGALLALLRYRSGSIWASVVAHGALNASTSMLLVGLAPTSQGVAGTLIGWPGWIVLSLVITVLAVTGSFRSAAQVSGAGRRGLEHAQG